MSLSVVPATFWMTAAYSPPCAERALGMTRVAFVAPGTGWGSAKKLEYHWTVAGGAAVNATAKMASCPARIVKLVGCRVILGGNVMTVSEAGFAVTMPISLLTINVYAPAFSGWILVSVSAARVAPARLEIGRASCRERV